MALAPISQEVHSISQKLGLSSDLNMIDRAWALEIGALQDVARIVALDHATLVIEVDSHAVMQEVSLRRKELVRKLNRHMPAPIFRQMVVRISQHYGR
jgi:hypothetical protein